ncbi:DnaK-related protein [hydrothermal vent metagenome]|uniref:DnaK-related protein n=1 Tax=hydrothermal vent metagenome TaxID=652676 RepID=A0A3B0XVN6_9ZZZZ
MKLNVPEQTTPSKDDFPNHPRKVKKWLTSLKRANMGDFARQIYNGLLILNRQAMPPKYRIENMETLREPTRYIFNQLHKHFVNRTLPLPEKSLKITHLNQALLNEMAMGYKVLIFEASNNLAKVDAKTTFLACERALHYYSELLLRSSQIYTELPKGMWWDIHRIYGYAELKKFHQKSINDPELSVKGISPEDYYKQILLFSLARPNALRQSDAERLFKSLNEWAKLTKISSKTPKNKLNRYFISKLDGDLPPNCVSENDLKNLQHIRSIETSKLVEHLQKMDTDTVDLHSAASMGDKVSQETIRTLVSSWSLCAKRRFSRAERKDEIRVAIGLNPIHKALNIEITPPKAKSRKPNKMFSLESIPENEQANRDIFAQQDPSFFISHPEMNKENDRSADAWDMVAKGRTLTESYAQEIQNQEQNMGELFKEDPDMHWKITNVSAGGYCLFWDSNLPSRALVGELISIREKEPDHTYQWRVGVIRWMQYSRENGLEIGVQVLSPKVISCQVQRLERKDEEPFNCLMLPGIKPIQQPSTLLLPAHAFRRSNTLKMQAYERDMEIKLGTVREHTGSFTQFQFSQINGTDTPNDEDDGSSNSGKTKNKNPDNFDSIWSSL